MLISKAFDSSKFDYFDFEIPHIQGTNLSSVYYMEQKYSNANVSFMVNDVEFTIDAVGYDFEHHVDVINQSSAQIKKTSHDGSIYYTPRTGLYNINSGCASAVIQILKDGTVNLDPIINYDDFRGCPH